MARGFCPRGCATSDAPRRGDKAAPTGVTALASATLKQDWQQYIVGWWNYFRHASQTHSVIELSGWIRRHIRKFLWQRWHHPKGRRAALQRLGIKGRDLTIARSSRGAWPNAKSRVLLVQQVPAIRGLCPAMDARVSGSLTLHATAGCGPACPVVWEP